MGGGALWHGPSERKPCRFRARSVDRFVLLMSIIMMMAMVATTMLTLMMLMILMILMNADDGDGAGDGGQDAGHCDRRVRP